MEYTRCLTHMYIYKVFFKLLYVKLTTSQLVNILYIFALILGSIPNLCFNIVRKQTNYLGSLLL